MDWKEIDRIRVPGFAMSRRGYDRHEVDRFLNRLADWLETDAPNEIGQMAVTRKLELVGKSASHILLTTEQESEEMKRRAQEEGAKIREDAQASSRATRSAADDYAKKTRAKAEEDARRTTDAATATAAKTVEAGEQRREAIEAVVSELTQRRDETLRELERLQGESRSSMSHYGPGGPWAIPWSIVQCESGGYNHPPNWAGASGYYQIIPATWSGFGGQGPHAYLASKAEQDRVAARIWRGRAGAHNWDCAYIVGLL